MVEFSALVETGGHIFVLLKPLLCVSSIIGVHHVHRSVSSTHLSSGGDVVVTAVQLHQVRQLGQPAQAAHVSRCIITQAGEDPAMDQHHGSHADRKRGFVLSCEHASYGHFLNHTTLYSSYCVYKVTRKDVDVQW